jgi:chorismate mutase
MQQLIDDLKTIPGVMGACVFNAGDGIRANNLPPLFKPERITEIAKNLIKISSAGQHALADVAMIFVSYEESSFLCRPISDSNYVIALCDPQINFNVLDMSLSLALEEMKSRGLVVPASPAPASPAVASASSNVSSASAPAVDEKQMLQNLETALNKVLGPMAGIVFGDVLETWQQTGGSDFTLLVEDLCREIDDESKAQQYRELVRAYLG